VIAARLANWVPSGSPVALPSFLREVTAWHASLENEDVRRMTASDCAHILKKRLKKEDRRRVVLDIVEIAKADGRVSDGERGFMSALLAIFGIKTSTNLELQPH
ncbi:MAG: TerB family tellurite resistance protein, partial [Nannocystaceae bacterium]